MVPRQSVGLIGCGVMGQNLALNIEGRGCAVVVYDTDRRKVETYLTTKAAGRNITGAASPSELAACLHRPRQIFMMLPAGKPVDQCIEGLLPHLDAGDILIDGGNSRYGDTNRRREDLERKGLLFVGAGISGGERGALEGPSIMPGGSPAAWDHVKPVLQAIAARTKDGAVCCDWVGEGGAGHFVKMVHNGIEYGDMQLICEAYHLMKAGLGMSPGDMSHVFEEWNRGNLCSYLVEITRDILSFRDEQGEAVVEKILDSAGQKGTGQWTAATALDVGQPLTLIAEAVLARFLSALKDERIAAAEVLASRTAPYEGDREILISDLRRALYASKIVSYAQGFQLMRAAAKNHGWTLDYGGIALLWRAGCIIRSAFLSNIKEAFDRDSSLVNLLLDPFFAKEVTEAQPSWRRVVETAVRSGIPVPAMSSALAYFDGYRSSHLPANLLQALRDYFGAHAYERVDRPRGSFYHTDWFGKSGERQVE